MDPLLLLLRSSLLTVVVTNAGDAVILVPVAGLCVLALPRPALLRSPWLWAAVFAGVGLRQLTTWYSLDDHVVVTTYWCGALALGLTSRAPRATLAASARLLIGTIFAFAAGWKLRSGQFLDGSFFRYTLLFDDRFAVVARLVGGTSSAARQANLDGLQRLVGATDQVGVDLALREGPRNDLVAQAFTAWGAVVEVAVAASFLVPVRARSAWLRNASLVAFAGTTYLLVPVGGFGTLLLVLGSAQAGSDRLRLGYIWGAIGLFVWAGIWPTLFL